MKSKIKTVENSFGYSIKVGALSRTGVKKPINKIYYEQNNLQKGL